MELTTTTADGKIKTETLMSFEEGFAAMAKIEAAQDEFLSGVIWIDGQVPMFEIKSPIKLTSKKAIAYCALKGQPDEFLFKVGENQYRFIRFEYSKQVAASRIYTKTNFKVVGWERFTANTTYRKVIFQAD